MAEYLTPLNRKMTIENKRIMFSVRNRMVNIKSNFKNRNNEVKCICGEKESMEHIWSCEQIRTKNIQKEDFHKIYNGNLTQQIGIFEKFVEKLENYQKKITEINNPGDPCISDPLLFKEQQGMYK